jgi:glycosyltransferase involved in cell wall biosynthesis
MGRTPELDVMHFIGSLSPGGAERNLYYLAPYMARSEYRYGICCMIDRGSFADEIESLGIPVFDLAYRRRKTIGSIMRLSRLLRRTRTRILHSHLFEPGLIGRLAAWQAGVPVIITHEHGKTLWKRWYHHWFERLAQHRTDLRIAVSADIRDLRIKHEKTPLDRITLIGNAVDPDRLKEGEGHRDRLRAELGLEDRTVVGCVGRIVGAKAYDIMLEVACRLRSGRRDAAFILIGDGPQRESLEARRRELGLTEGVSLLGMREDIPGLLAAMDIYLITSLREGLPLSLIEAMMAGKPVVSTRVGGIPEVIEHGVDGLLVEPGDVEGTVAALKTLLDDPGRRAAMGERGRRKAIDRYAPSRVLGIIESRYAEILERKGLRARAP